MLRAWLLLPLLWATGAECQSWVAMGGGPNGASQVSTLYGDTVLDLLLAGGTFTYMVNENDTILGVGQATWNGGRWDSLAHRIGPTNCLLWPCLSSQTYWYFRYQGHLYACGEFGFPLDDTLWNWNIARLNEDSMRWEALECVNSTAGILTWASKSMVQDTLYGTGYITNICGYPNSPIYKYDGSAFHEFEPWFDWQGASSDYVGSVFKYQGQNYMTGGFYDPISMQSHTLLRYTGTGWEPPPGWNTYAPIKDVLIKDGKLYVCGYFFEADGAPGNHVAMFDGSQWSNMGGGLIEQPGSTYGLAYDMMFWNDELYVVGQFEYAGDIEANNIAKWNGYQWCSLGGEFSNPDGPLLSVAVWHDSLYVSGGFTQIDGEPIKMVAQWVGSVVECSTPIGIEEGESPSLFNLHPNPTSTLLQITSAPSEARTVLLTDPLGRVVLNQPVNGQTSLTVQGLAPGPYLAVLLDAAGHRLGTVRWVKE